LSAKKRKDSRQNNRDAGAVVDAAALGRLTLQVRNLLAFHQEVGIPGYPAAADLLACTAKKKASPSPPQVRRTGAVEKSGPVAEGAPSTTSPARQLATIARELADCRSCSAGRRGPVVPGQGSAAPLLFVIGDCCRGTDNSAVTVWGEEEDALFWKMMAAIGLDRESVYVTNCIKCGQDKGVPPAAELGRSCFSFLERELIALQPGLICTMGELATSLLLGSRTPLVRMRGRFHRYRYPHGGSGQVMPTFHPAFLLQHPEMKRAAWMDLQALQRRLPR